jgi:hypothetical protein
MKSDSVGSEKSKQASLFLVIVTRSVPVISYLLHYEGDSKNSTDGGNGCRSGGDAGGGARLS